MPALPIIAVWYNDAEGDRDPMSKKKKVRVDLRKNRSKPPRPKQWTRGFHDHGFTDEATAGDERVRAKGDLSRRRTIIAEQTVGEQGGDETADRPAIDAGECLPGRVLRVHGPISVVETEDGRQYRCARAPAAAHADHRRTQHRGDRRSRLDSAGQERSRGLIERVEPRHGVLTRASRGREHVLVANVDQVVIVMALVEPDLKQHLIDRYLASAAQGGIEPIICLNKADLVHPEPFESLIGLYSQLGITTFLTSAPTGQGIDRLRERLRGRQTVFAGQSGVGKSSLLNAIQPNLELRVREVSDVNQKGKHTTTTAQLIRLDFGGWVVDTPGIRQFELWDIIAGGSGGLFPGIAAVRAAVRLPRLHAHA